MKRMLMVLALTGLAAACAAPAQQVPVAAAPAAEFDPVGVYDFTTQVDGSTLAGVLTFRRDAEGRLTALVSTPVTGDLPITDVTQTGRDLALRANLDGQSMIMTINVSEAGVLIGGWELSSGISGGVSGKLRGS